MRRGFFVTCADRSGDISFTRKLRVPVVHATGERYTPWRLLKQTWLVSWVFPIPLSLPSVSRSHWPPFRCSRPDPSGCVSHRPRNRKSVALHDRFKGPALHYVLDSTSFREVLVALPTWPSFFRTSVFLIIAHNVMRSTFQTRGLDPDTVTIHTLFSEFCLGFLSLTTNWPTPKNLSYWFPSRKLLTMVLFSMCGTIKFRIISGSELNVTVQGTRSPVHLYLFFNIIFLYFIYNEYLWSRFRSLSMVISLYELSSLCQFIHGYGIIYYLFYISYISKDWSLFM